MYYFTFHVHIRTSFFLCQQKDIEIARKNCRLQDFTASQGIFHWTYLCLSLKPRKQGKCRDKPNKMYVGGRKLPGLNTHKEQPSGTCNLLQNTICLPERRAVREQSANTRLQCAEDIYVLHLFILKLDSDRGTLKRQ